MTPNRKRGARPSDQSRGPCVTRARSTDWNGRGSIESIRPPIDRRARSLAERNALATVPETRRYCSTFDGRSVISSLPILGTRVSLHDRRIALLLSLSFFLPLSTFFSLPPPRRDARARPIPRRARGKQISSHRKLKGAPL